MAYTEAQRIAKVGAALDAALDNLVTLEEAGPQAWADYSVDGESYQYEGAKRGLEDRIERLTILLRKLQPFNVRSRVMP